MVSHRDLGYKYLFAHPELVRELLADFTQFSWLGACDAGAFERVNPGYVSDRFSERHDDIVWRVYIGGRWLYIYLILEFQSGVDRWMALRMQVYIGLLYQDLVKRKELGPGDLLPPVLPLVFYTGAPAWNAATDLDSLIRTGPDLLAPFQARQRYALIDQQRLDPAALASKQSVLALLFRLELSEAPDVLLTILPMLGAWLREDAQAPLRRSVAAWVEQILSRQFNDATVAAALEAQGDEQMGVRKFETWYEYVLDQGRQQGMQLGIEQERELAVQTLRSALTRVLEKRFGSISPALVQRFEQATAEQLSDWLMQALDTPSVEALLGRLVAH